MKKAIVKIFFWLLLASISIYIIYSFKSEKSVYDLRNRWDENKSNYVLVDDISIHYRKFGLSNDSIPILLIPSYNFSGYIFQNLALEMKAEKDCYYLDLPNTGLSESNKDEIDWKLDQYSDFIRDFMAELKIKKAYLVGQGFGAEVAMDFSVKYPDMVEKLISINPLGRQEDNENTTRYFKLLKTPYLGKFLYNIKPEFLMKKFYNSLFYGNKELSEPLFERFEDDFNRIGFQNRIEFILSDTTNNRMLDIHKIPVKTLFLESQRGFYYKNSRMIEYKNKLPSSDTLSLESKGQLPMINYPDKLNKIIFAFINQK